MQAIPSVVRAVSRGAGGDRVATVLCRARGPAQVRPGRRSDHVRHLGRGTGTSKPSDRPSGEVYGPARLGGRYVDGMPERKKRVPIDRTRAARILYMADRTCCVCRTPGKAVQIHHIDDNPSNNVEANLAALCLDCHHLTQISGGFGRHLDADQVSLYRDSWLVAVRRQRGEIPTRYRSDDVSNETELELVTSIAEIYREGGDYVSLAMHYNIAGNAELRDKYVDLALDSGNVDDADVIFLRGTLQQRPDLIPEDVAQCELDRQEQLKDWSQRARTLRDLGRWRESAQDYCRSVLESLASGNTFSAAYYLKEMVNEGLIDELFLIAFSEAEELWWRMRALQELDDREALVRLLRENEAEIRSSRNLSMIEMLELYIGDSRAYVDARKSLARNEVASGDGIVGYIQEQGGEDKQPRSGADA